MILSSREITTRLRDGERNGPLIIRPYNEECQQPASYDLRVAEEYLVRQGACTLVPSLEWIELPVDLAATLRCRSSFARRGVIISGGFVDPGFRGQLTLCLINMGGEDIVIRPGERVVQMIIQEVSSGERPYNGRYQDSRGAVEAK
jgi:dCTP deaminase